MHPVLSSLPCMLSPAGNAVNVPAFPVQYDTNPVSLCTVLACPFPRVSDGPLQPSQVPDRPSRQCDKVGMCVCTCQLRRHTQQ